MNDKTGLLREMNKINCEVSRVFRRLKPLDKSGQVIECNVMGCRNKPIHKFLCSKGDYYIYSCNKHKEDFSPSSFGGIFKKVDSEEIK